MSNGYDAVRPLVEESLYKHGVMISAPVEKRIYNCILTNLDAHGDLSKEKTSDEELEALVSRVIENITYTPFRKALNDYLPGYIEADSINLLPLSELPKEQCYEYYSIVNKYRSANLKFTSKTHYKEYCEKLAVVKHKLDSYQDHPVMDTEMLGYRSTYLYHFSENLEEAASLDIKDLTGLYIAEKTIGTAANHKPKLLSARNGVTFTLVLSKLIEKYGYPKAMELYSIGLQADFTVEKWELYMENEEVYKDIPDEWWVHTL